MNVNPIPFLRFAAVDIGSNSIRLLIENVVDYAGEPQFKKAALVRVPIRLGEVVFQQGIIPESTVLLLQKAMTGFRFLMEANQVVYFKACATSAMREAANGEKVVQQLFENTGIQIQIIDGETEAEIIYNGQKVISKKMSRNCLFVDVGGGSTEMTLLVNGKKVSSFSFPVGTLRILYQAETEAGWQAMRQWLKEQTRNLPDLVLVGSGGNINRLSKLAQLKKDKPLSATKLREWVEYIRSLSIEERIRDLDLNPDRADVIVPAGDIFLQVMKWIDAEEIFIPKIGLSDGIVREAYKEWKRNQSLPEL
jgi:exopolyphosphatase/guanosine-5'-triphosphate,3'-diphosphate pyrophosphatase